MSPEKRQFLHFSILSLCILFLTTNSTTAHSLHTYSQQQQQQHPPLGKSSGAGLLSQQQQLFGAHGRGMESPAELEDVDSDRLSNVNRLSYSPLLMLPMRHQIPALHPQQQQQQQQHHWSYPSHSDDYAATPNQHFIHQQQQQQHQHDNDMDEEQEALLEQMVAERGHQSMFGEMRVLGNAKHRTPHYGVVSRTSTDVATGGQLMSNHKHQQQMPYKHQTQFLKTHNNNINLGLLQSNEIPRGGAEGHNLRLLKKRTQEADDEAEEEQEAKSESSSSSETEKKKQNRRLHGDHAEDNDDAEKAKESTKDKVTTTTTTASPATVAEEKGQRYQVSKKSGNPFLGSGSSASMMIPHSIASQLMLRSARGQRQYDVPQIGK